MEIKRERLIIKTKKKKEVVDITDEIAKVLTTHPDTDLCHLFLVHTTAALSTADLDQGTDLDMLDAFTAMIPRLKYRHPHDPSHVPDHILSSIIGPSLILPVEDSQPVLGTWQRIVLIELDGPREREIVFSIFKNVESKK